jgi:phosphoribosylamine--glycine ligase
VKVLLVGSGGREHALAWALAKSPLLTKLYCAPGNAGIAQVAECVAIPATDFEGLVQFATEARIDFAVIAADAQLVGGLWDVMEGAGIRALGPSKAAAVLEGSKGFVKDLCMQAGIPTARQDLRRRPGLSRGDQGRWPGRRQGRDHRRRQK